MLSARQREALLGIARAAVRRRLEKLPAIEPEVDDDALRARCGAFVSLHAGTELRGCIGLIEAERPLFVAVAGCAVSAATADPRFPPVTLEELESIRFEISVLSPPQPVAGPGEVQVGRHGVIVTGGGRKALLLPQVAPHEGWDTPELLTAACHKAGLPKEAWRGNTVRLEVFTAEVFSEET